MRRKITAFFVLFFVQFFLMANAHSADVRGVSLRVALYPYVPDRLAIFQKIEAVFEAQNPGVNLELVDDQEYRWNYYGGALQAIKADVYEVDTVLLADLVAAGKVAPITLPDIPFTKAALSAVDKNGKNYGVPHWLCGKFLFYEKSDHEIAGAATWSELSSLLADRNEAMLLDLKGKLTLGEWYLTVLSGLYGAERAQAMLMASDKLDPLAVEKLKMMLSSCPDGFCRSEDLHNRVGFNSRSFIAGKVSAYVGYSESLNSGIQYALDNCTSSSGCVDPRNLAVRALPAYTGAEGGEGVGWVDALAIDAALDPDKRKLAEAFIAFMVQPETYKLILEPEWGEAPRYIIPARTDLKIEGAPLYPELYSVHAGRKTGTKLGLNAKLREMGQKLDCALPVNRSDRKTLERCSQ